MVYELRSASNCVCLPTAYSEFLFFCGRDDIFGPFFTSLRCCAQFGFLVHREVRVCVFLSSFAMSIPLTHVVPPHASLLALLQIALATCSALGIVDTESNLSHPSLFFSQLRTFAQISTCCLLTVFPEISLSQWRSIPNQISAAFSRGHDLSLMPAGPDG